jgi:glycine oxidase
VARRGPEIAVVGAGITGAFSAYFLARLGARTTLIERNEIGAHASGNNPGGLNPLHGPGIPGPMQALALESFRLHRESWPEIRRLSGLAFAAREAPRLHLATDAADVADLERIQENHDATAGFSARRLDRDELLAAQPGLARAVIDGVCTQGNAIVGARPYTQAVVGSAVALGVRLIKGDVRGLRVRGDRVTAVLVDSSPISCDGVVVATGPWCAEPADWLGVRIPVEPVKGELLLADAPSGGLSLDIAWRDIAVYGAEGERVWLGGTEERAGFDRTPTGAARESILARVGQVLPAIDRSRVLRQSVGLRPVSADGFPIVGHAPGWRNACLALGGGRKGMLLSAGIGRAAAELMVRGETELPIAPCSSSRWPTVATSGVAG